ncbi:hypothetical protein BH20ACT21_BH20ACT21_07070 [soil metagenome]
MHLPVNPLAFERPGIPARVVPRRSRTFQVRPLLAPRDQGEVTLSVLTLFPVRSTVKALPG